MASILLRPFLRPTGLGLGFGLSSAALNLTLQRQIRLDSGDLVLSKESSRRIVQVPVTKQGQLNPRAVRQLSSGSIFGLCAGLAVSTFSRSLALLIGLLVVGVQWAASNGINIFPYDKLERYVTGMDLRSAIQDNVAFKVSFGVTFAMASFMQF